MNTQQISPILYRILSVSTVLLLALSSFGGALAKGPTTYIVNTIDDVDDGHCNVHHCSLREAINAANDNLAADTIEFDIPEGSSFTIQPLSPLPDITDPVTIDGTTQPSYSGNPIVELDGTNAGEGEPDVGISGLVIKAGGSTVKGLVINRFSGSGVRLAGVGTEGNKIQGNFIGTDLAGTSPLGNAVGIYVTEGAANNEIGGTEDGARNVISGNLFNVGLGGGGGTTGNAVQDNYIGTDRSGFKALANSGVGVIIFDNGRDNLIGGTDPGAGNLISGNTIWGVLMIGGGVTGNLVQGNFIGTDATATEPLGNSPGGVWILGNADNMIGGTEPGAGNLISGNAGEGVRLSNVGTEGNKIQGNLIGTDANGTMPLGNLSSGVLINEGAADNLIGGTEPGAGNLISGNKSNGVAIVDTGTTGNTVQGNFIGTDVTGSTVTGPAYPDPGDFTVTVEEACPTYPAGTDIEGWVSESDDPLAPWSGIPVLFVGTAECTDREMLGEASLIYRYRLDFTEETQLTSIVVTGGNFNGPDNVLRVLDADRNVLGTAVTYGDIPYIVLKGVTGMVFYVDEFDTSSEYRFRQSIVINGPVPLGNVENGVLLAGGASNNFIGGTDPSARNLISGNIIEGVAIYDPDTTGNIVQGNYIGADVTGTVALGNFGRGVTVEGGPTDNLIGGTQAHAGNLISGNELAGIRLGGVGTERNKVQGNFIGTDINGMSPLGNGFVGVRIAEGAAKNWIGGTEDGARNIISGNGSSGVSIDGEGTMYNVLQGNFIGTDASGAAALPNNGEGVLFGEGASGSLIGGDDVAAGNTIAFNAGAGIALDSAAGSGNLLLSNSVFSNEGLGIDLGNDGVTPNDRLDLDAGPNDLQNFPEITSVTRQGSSVIFRGVLFSTPSTPFGLIFFSNEACDPSGFGEGQAFLGFDFVTTNRAGVTNFSITLPVSLPEGAFVTATATDLASGSTSEFSQCFGPAR